MVSPPTNFSCVLWNIDITIHPLFLRWCSPALMKLLKAIFGLNINMWSYFWISRYTNLLIEGFRESYYIYKLLNFNICLTNLLVKLHVRCRCKYRLLCRLNIIYSVWVCKKYPFNYTKFTLRILLGIYKNYFFHTYWRSLAHLLIILWNRYLHNKQNTVFSVISSQCLGICSYFPITSMLNPSMQRNNVTYWLH